MTPFSTGSRRFWEDKIQQRLHPRLGRFVGEFYVRASEQPLTALGFELLPRKVWDKDEQGDARGARGLVRFGGQLACENLACKHRLDPETCPRCAAERPRWDREPQQSVERRLEWERRMREQQRCFLEDPSHVRKRGAPEGGLYQLVDGQVTLRIGARSQLRVGGRFGAIGMYWDFGDEPPGLYCKRGHGDDLYRIVLTVDGEFFEEEEEMIVNIRCWCCTLVERCSECVIEEQRRQQWRQPKLRLKAQQEKMLAWTGQKRLRYRDAHSSSTCVQCCLELK